MLYEIRLYAIPPGRLADIGDRMLHDAPPLFLKHGMRAVAHWNVVSGPDLPAFLYVLEWRDAVERDACWRRFYDDPQWWEIRARTNGGSELVESYGLWLMKPNAAWPLPFLPLPAPAAGEIHQMILHHVAIGRAAAVSDHIQRVVIPSIRLAGGKVLAVFEMVAGPRFPAVAIFIAWRDFTSGLVDWTVPRGRSEPISEDGARLLGRRDSYVLQPVTANDAA